MKGLNLAVVQFTPGFGEKEKNQSRMLELVEDVTADIIVFPELCTTGYFFLSRDEVTKVAEPVAGPSGEFFQDMARNKNAVIVAGFAERHQKHLFNACLVVVPEVKNPYVYRKTHLFYKEHDCFDPGDTGFFVVEDKKRDIFIGPMVCYDWRFPESARILMLQGADVIACPANLVTDAWQMVMPARAIENKVYLAVANRIGSEVRNGETLHFKGRSAIYGYHGETLANADALHEAVVSAEIHPQATRDKSFNALNNVLTDRQPQHYKKLIE